MTRRPGPQWGIVSTVKAPSETILNFCAWHLELGAARIYLHFDDPKAPVPEVLRAHPAIRVTRTTSGYWTKLGKRRPRRHQPRQTANATRVYASTPPLDWLAHIDVDEFLLPQAPLADLLAGLPAGCHVARMRPAEALYPPEGTDTAPTFRFRGFSADPDLRRAQTAALYPRSGRWLEGGMLSHVAGKLFVRPGLPGAELRIHNLRSDLGPNPGMQELPSVTLAHFHAGPWPEWRARFDFRHQEGSYRAELRPARPRNDQAMTLHDYLAGLQTLEGEAGLRAFYEETCRDSPSLRAALANAGLLHEAQMDFPTLRARHFPPELKA